MGTPLLCSQGLVCGVTKECFLSLVYHNQSPSLQPAPKFTSPKQMSVWQQNQSACPSFLPEEWRGHPLQEPEKKDASFR